MIPSAPWLIGDIGISSGGDVISFHNLRWWCKLSFHHPKDDMDTQTSWILDVHNEATTWVIERFNFACSWNQGGSHQVFMSSSFVVSAVKLGKWCFSGDVYDGLRAIAAVEDSPRGTFRPTSFYEAEVDEEFVSRVKVRMPVLHARWTKELDTVGIRLCPWLVVDVCDCHVC